MVAGLASSHTHVVIAPTTWARMPKRSTGDFDVHVKGVCMGVSWADEPCLQTAVVGDRFLTLASESSSSQELEVRQLVKRYSAQSVIGPLSFSVNAGEFVSLLGPSGCGKTTTLRCIAGFEIPSEGGIYLDGERIDQRPPNRRNIGLVFQSYALFPHLTVFENVAFGLRIRRCGEARAEAPGPRGHRARRAVAPYRALPKQLSGGQQQRVAIARSVVLEPRLLLFDEPLSNLDLKLRVTMRAELRNLQRRLGKTAIYVTHDQGEALALSDRIVVMSNGRIEQVGTPVEVYERPATAFVADFIGSSNLLSRRNRQQCPGLHQRAHPNWPSAADFAANCRRDTAVGLQR